MAKFSATPNATSSLQLIDSEINPHVDKWEADKSFPAHEVFKKLGSAGFLGVNKPTGKLADSFGPLRFSQTSQSENFTFKVWVGSATV